MWADILRVFENEDEGPIVYCVDTVDALRFITSDRALSMEAQALVGVKAVLEFDEVTDSAEVGEPTVTRNLTSVRARTNPKPLTPRPNGPIVLRDNTNAGARREPPPARATEDESP
jgi:hypothetical protein